MPCVHAAVQYLYKLDALPRPTIEIVLTAARKVLNDGERQKLNDGADAFFYNYPRICYHVDEGFLKHLTQLYR